MFRKLEIDFHGRKLSLETGRLAKQSHGAVLAQYGETVVLATVVSAYQSRDKIDFLPLTVYYKETQIVVSVLSIDKENDSDTLALIATSAALEVSDIPYEGPVAAVRMGR